MKNTLVLALVALLFSCGTTAALADTTPEFSRTSITRSSDHSDIQRPTRTRGQTIQPASGSGGTVLDVTYDNEDGELSITFEGGSDSGTNITVIINGEVVVSNGGQNTGGGNNTSQDGADGTDGADGSSSAGDETDQNEDGADSADESDSRTDSRARDTDFRNGAGERPTSRG